MGGFGSGRQSDVGAKQTTESFRSIDIRQWKRDGWLESGQTFSWKWIVNDKVISSISVHTELGQVVLSYSHQQGKGECIHERYPVRLEWSQCNFGGIRPWFLCPVAGCGQRVAILYSGQVFACRHCHKLAYESQRETSYDRAARRVNKIRERLRWKQGVLNKKGLQKPKGMHSRTFARLNKEHDAYEDKSLTGISAKLNSILVFLGK